MQVRGSGPSFYVKWVGYVLLSDNMSGVLLITAIVGRSFQQPGKVNEMPLCDVTTRHRLLTDLRLLEGM